MAGAGVGPHRLAPAAWLGAGDTEVIDLVAVVECGEGSHVAAPSPSFSTFPSLLPGKPGAAGRWKPGDRALRGQSVGRARGGARGPEEVRAGQAWKRAERTGGGDGCRRPRAPRPQRRRTKGGLCARRGPWGPAEVRAARPRPRVPGGGAASSSSSAARAPGAQVSLVSAARGSRLGRWWRRVGAARPTRPRPPPMCIYELDERSPHRSHKALSSPGKGRGGGGPRRSERFLSLFFFFLKQRSLSLKTR